MRGESAIRQLKTDGGYASLAAALAAARNQVNAAPAKSDLSGALFYANNPGRQLQAAFALQQQLVASDGATGDIFGFSVALSGDTVVVGAPIDSRGQGSAYVFTRNGATWTLQQKLFAGDGETSDFFGDRVAVSGDTIVVGADQDDIVGKRNQGSAYVFTRSGTVWTRQQKLIANDGAADDRFGSSVAVSGDTVVAGADHAAIGANRNQGAAYVFTRSGAAWTLQQKLTAADGAIGDSFGVSAALGGDTVVVGAYTDTIGANGSQGSAYVFTRSGLIWTEQQKLTAADGAIGDQFGESVALSGDTVVVGSNTDDMSANEDQGSAYVFTRSGAVWTEQQKLTAADGDAFDRFGISVAINSDTIVVGSFGDTFETNFAQGSAYVFTRRGAVWTEQQKLTANEGATGDFFGISVAVSSDTVVVGVDGDDIGANDDQGSAYVFVSPPCPTVTLDPENLPDVIVGAPYSQTITASGGAGPYQFSLSDGSLPPGLILAQNGLLSGTPTTAGTYRFTVTATILSSLCSGSRSYTLTVTAPCPLLTLNPPLLPPGKTGAAYSQQLSVSGGAAPFSFTVIAGALPPKLTLSSEGALNGVLTTSGSFKFTVRATDANGCTGTRNYVLFVTGSICPVITVNPNTLPDGALGVEYHQTMTAVGGRAPHAFTLSGGALPTGLSLAANGALSGIPVVIGSFNFTVRATDTNGCAGARSYTLMIKK
ncbi:MAG: putative Ig domain-containing protein [Blastocatellia bacterium]